MYTLVLMSISMVEIVTETDKSEYERQQEKVAKKHAELHKLNVTRTVCTR